MSSSNRAHSAVLMPVSWRRLPFYKAECWIRQGRYDWWTPTSDFWTIPRGTSFISRPAEYSGLKYRCSESQYEKVLKAEEISSEHHNVDYGTCANSSESSLIAVFDLEVLESMTPWPILLPVTEMYHCTWPGRASAYVVALYVSPWDQCELRCQSSKV
ncbi:hypothetical protein PoB_001862100 [Plakobranchus ocellatus]|uniref:Uncharacterized protein n=1 Tax=Plakobranchus ocellatus TaxID=259542 RepID=A0AAV3Z887_9GAST|nr:hypothetical protein PoB_001862100 [Plakobranchus ocellatus]